MNRDVCGDKELCTGCTACANVCPINCIDMRADAEGFLYPVIDESRCVNCKICETICPVNQCPETYPVIEGYIARFKDMNIVDNSTSGGTCAAFANYTFDRNGLIFGVGYDKSMRIRHFGIDSSEKERVSEMMGSKYVQSLLGYSFKEVQKFLKEGRIVCFTGTPCQIAGLKAFLMNDYENLITIDLVCHGVSSPLLFKKYVSYMEKKYKGKAVDIRFRNKTYGYHSGTMMIEFENGKKYYGSARVDYMLKAYFKGGCSRKSCYRCPFKGMERCSDYTVFDSWNVNKLVKNLKDDDKGFTNIYVHTEKGRRVIKELNKVLYLWGAEPDRMLELDGVMINQKPVEAAFREKLIKDISYGDFEDQMQKYLWVSNKDNIVEKVKAVLYKMGLIRIINKLKK